MPDNERKCKTILEAVCEHFKFKLSIFGKGRSYYGIDSNDGQLILANDGCILTAKSFSILLGNAMSSRFFMVPIYNKNELADDEIKFVENEFYGLTPVELCLRLQLFGYKLEL